MEKYKKVIQNNKFKISAPTWNKKFELPDKSYSASDVQDYFKNICEKYEAASDNPPTTIYVKR